MGLLRKYTIITISIGQYDKIIFNSAARYVTSLSPEVL